MNIWEISMQRDLGNWKRILGDVASRRAEDAALRRQMHNLTILPGMPGKRSNTIYGWDSRSQGARGAFVILESLDLIDARMIWTGISRGQPAAETAKREKRKMTAEENSTLNDIDYVLLNVSRNLWVGPNGPDGLPTYTKVVSEALTMKRIPALDQFVEACKTNSGDYNVPIRMQDLVACVMGLDE